MAVNTVVANGSALHDGAATNGRVVALSTPEHSTGRVLSRA